MKGSKKISEERERLNELMPKERTRQVGNEEEREGEWLGKYGYR